MNLRPSEADLVRRFLDGKMEPPPDEPFAIVALSERLGREAPPLGAEVFRLECQLGTDATKDLKAVQQQRQALRTERGVKALRKGEGPALPKVLWAPTMNEYTALDPRQKEELRAVFDAHIATLRASFPQWSCGSVDRLVPRPGKTLKCKCQKRGWGGQKGRPEVAVAKARPCRHCAGTGVIAAPPLVVREGGRRRAAVVIRESSVRPDEESIDAHLGGKIPIDRLVQAGVLRGDNDTWLVRYGQWRFAPAGEGRVLISVHEIG